MSSVIFVILGIGILGVSFVVALVSLVREERQNNQILETQAKSVPENPKGSATLQSVVVPTSGGGQIDDLAAKVAIEQEKQETQSTQPSPPVQEPQPDEQKEEHQPFPWEEEVKPDFPWEDNAGQSQSQSQSQSDSVVAAPTVVPGDNVLEDVKVDANLNQEEIIPSVHRFPTLQQKPVGEVKLSDLAKSDDA